MNARQFNSIFLRRRLFWSSTRSFVRAQSSTRVGLFRRCFITFFDCFFFNCLLLLFVFDSVRTFALCFIFVFLEIDVIGHVKKILVVFVLRMFVVFFWRCFGFIVVLGSVVSFAQLQSSLLYLLYVFLRANYWSCSFSDQATTKVVPVEHSVACWSHSSARWHSSPCWTRSDGSLLEIIAGTETRRRWWRRRSLLAESWGTWTVEPRFRVALIVTRSGRRMVAIWLLVPKGSLLKRSIAAAKAISTVTIASILVLLKFDKTSYMTKFRSLLLIQSFMTFYIRGATLEFHHQSATDILEKTINSIFLIVNAKTRLEFPFSIT